MTSPYKNRIINKYIYWDCFNMNLIIKAVNNA